MSLIVLLILAGISLSAVFFNNGIFNRAEASAERYREAKAREVLETVLLTDGQFDKNINPEYNQNEYLDKLIKSEILGSEVIGDIAIVDGYAYELDRSVPKIGRYLGLAKDLIFPTVTVSESQLAIDYRTASFTVTAIEETNGINKIEIWLNGEKIEILTNTYNNIKTEITENFTVNKNGTYTVKVYGDLMASATVEVTGIVPAVEFLPNGSTEWKKEHTTKIIVKGTGEKVTSLKYKWTTSGANEPAISEFTENCPNDNIITGKDITGTYYLWVLLETETGKTNICGSEGFNFDNEGPQIHTFTSTKYSNKGISLNLSVSDMYSGITKLEVYVDDELKFSNNIDNPTNKIERNENVLNLTTGSHKVRIYVEDALGNYDFKELSANTYLYAWNKYSCIDVDTYTVSETRRNGFTFGPEAFYVTLYSSAYVSETTHSVVLGRYISLR